MPRKAGLSPLGLIFRVLLACAPGGSALPFGQAGGIGAEPLGGTGTGIRDREVQGGFHPLQALRRAAVVLSGAGPAALVSAISRVLPLRPADGLGARRSLDGLRLDAQHRQFNHKDRRI